MRIVGGKYKRRRFDVPKNFEARPTTDMAKENLFNVLSNLIDFEGIRALDLFAGTGGISFELVSRGASDVVCLEKNTLHYNFIKKVKELLGAEELHPIKGDAFKYLDGKIIKPFDFIFADPPYNLPTLEDIPAIILTGNLLSKDGIFVMEHSDKNDFSALPFFWQRRTYGSVNFS
ncbi:MAG: RsmD family RNA methyltransferase, partial [Bacteroidales bacterium]|nr:RsmD family RNA methyltransferase [Bacteroidales bacterium]